MSIIVRPVIGHNLLNIFLIFQKAGGKWFSKETVDLCIFHFHVHLIRKHPLKGLVNEFIGIGHCAIQIKKHCFYHLFSTFPISYFSSLSISHCRTLALLLRCKRRNWTLPLYPVKKDLSTTPKKKRLIIKTPPEIYLE